MRHRRINWIVSDFTRRVLKRYLEWSARLKGQRFHCRCLAGESEYNLTVNCDLTLSCTCQDYDGSGHLGDLNQHSFREVFFGPVAQRFREELAKGKLPIMTCTRCGDLVRVPKSQSRAVTGLPGGAGGVARPAAATGSQSPASAAERDLDRQIFAGPKPRLPYRGMLLENTVRCNIDCIGCDRQSAARIRTTAQMELAKKLDGLAITLKAKAGTKEKLYGQVTAAEIAAEVERKTGVSLDKRKIELEAPIRKLGSYEAVIRFSSELSSKIKVNVKAEEAG
jgi:hypothetical protein